MWDKANYVLASAGDGPWSWDHLGWYWGMGMHGLFWLVFLILAVVAVVVVVRALAGGGSAVKAPSDQAADDLRHRHRRPQRHALTTDQYLHTSGTQDSLGSRQGGDHSRHRGQRHAHPLYARTVASIVTRLD